ncbi:hypothetical protein TVAG_536910, partial [Trichomonas vaginalis G3]
MESQDDQHASRELKEISNDLFAAYDAIYKIQTLDDDEINKIFEFIKVRCFGILRISPVEIMQRISDEFVYQNRYIRSCWSLFIKIYQEYRPKRVTHISDIFDYFFYKEYEFTLSGQHPIKFIEYEKQNISFDIHIPHTIYRAIMDDDIRSFISRTQEEEFNIDHKLKSDFYPENEGGYSYLELCCYHGAVNCFKFLRTEFNLENITSYCLAFSYLGGNIEIINECLKNFKPDSRSMEYAIISRNPDFIMNLVNEYHIEIHLESCIGHENVQAYCMYYNETKNLNACFPYSTCFHYLPLCQYFLSKHPNINQHAIGFKGNTALHFAAWGDLIDIVQLLLSHGANINEKNENG